MIGLFPVNNLENQINVQHHPRNNRQTFTNAFKISDTEFIKNYKLKERGIEVDEMIKSVLETLSAVIRFRHYNKCKLSV